MSHRSSLLTVLGRSLAARLDRLRDTLDGLRQRLREAVVRSVGETVGAAVREALGAVLVHGAPDEEKYVYDSPPHYHDPPLWHDQREPHWQDGWEWIDTADDSNQSRSMDPSAPEPEGRRTAATSLLLLGCQAVAWWLRRHQTHFPALAALGVGTACGVAAYLGAPVVIAGVGLAGSALGLAALASATRSGAAALDHAVAE